MIDDLTVPRVRRGSGQKLDITFTSHAITRLAERAMKSEPEEARSWLVDNTAVHPQFTRKRPEWLYKTNRLKHMEDTWGYLVMRPHAPSGKPRRVAFPLVRIEEGNKVRYVSTTCLVEGFDDMAQWRRELNGSE